MVLLVIVVGWVGGGCGLMVWEQQSEKNIVDD